MVTREHPADGARCPTDGGVSHDKPAALASCGVTAWIIIKTPMPTRYRTPFNDTRQTAVNTRLIRYRFNPLLKVGEFTAADPNLTASVGTTSCIMTTVKSTTTDVRTTSSDRFSSLSISRRGSMRVHFKHSGPENCGFRTHVYPWVSNSALITFLTSAKVRFRGLRSLWPESVLGDESSPFSTPKFAYSGGITLLFSNPGFFKAGVEVSNLCARLSLRTGMNPPSRTDA